MKALLMSFFVLPLSALAQPTIHHMGDYSIGDQITNLDCNPMAPGNSGANINWDFSALTALGSGSDTIRQWIIAPPTPPTFTGAAFVITDGQGTYDYYTKTTASNFELGSLDSVNATTTSYSHPFMSCKRPIAMSDTWSDTITANEMMTPPVPTSVKISLTVLADGYGTLKLPNGTYNNVLRVKMTFAGYTTISAGPITDTLQFKTYAWAWYDDNHSNALLTVDSSYSLITGAGGGGDTSADVQYLLKEHTAGVTALAENRVQFSAAINNDVLVLNSPFASGSIYHVNVFAISGQKVFEQEFAASANNTQLTMSHYLSSGIYLVTLMKDNEAASLTTLKVVKQ